ncbi:MAG: xylulokinase [Ruminococcaceae bacterium]|nr:xylulokinase [Oscillospiraceae bacterium]
MNYLIGIDVGTSGTKSVLFDTEGRVIASETVEYYMQQPRNGWAEEDPADWWDAVCKTLKGLTEKVNPHDIAGLGLSGQMHSLVLLDKENEVIRPSILWCDQRTHEECREIENILGREKLIEITANPTLTGFTASKLVWVKKHEPENFERTAHILLAKDYIRLMLTGEYATEVSDASGMQLLDVGRRCWSREVCEGLGIDMSKLPRVYESPELTGRVTKKAAALTGLPEGLPVAGGAGDNAAAAVGMGVWCEGKAFTTVGTSGVVFAPTDSPVIDPLGRVHTFCAAVPHTWHVMGVTQAAGLSLNWFRRIALPHKSYREIDEKCAGLPIGSERLIYMPYLMGERTPHLDSDARGVFFGLSALHNEYHMARAVMEGVSFSLNDCMEILRGMNIGVSDMALCGGGGKSDLWCQMLSDVYGVNVKRMESDEGAALGAAILGGCAAGVYSSVGEACEAIVRVKNVTVSSPDAHAEYEKYYGIYKSLYPCMRENFARLNSI